MERLWRLVVLFTQQEIFHPALMAEQKKVKKMKLPHVVELEPNKTSCSESNKVQA